VQDGVEAVDGLLDGGQVHHVDDEVLGLGVGPFQQVDTADVVPPVQQLGGAGLAGPAGAAGDDDLHSPLLRASFPLEVGGDLPAP